MSSAGQKWTLALLSVAAVATVVAAAISAGLMFGVAWEPGTIPTEEQVLSYAMATGARQFAASLYTATWAFLVVLIGVYYGVVAKNGGGFRTQVPAAALFVALAAATAGVVGGWVMYEPVSVIQMQRASNVSMASVDVGLAAAALGVWIAALVKR
jgi:hypothetical protein